MKGAAEKKAASTSGTGTEKKAEEGGAAKSHGKHEVLDQDQQRLKEALRSREKRRKKPGKHDSDLHEDMREGIISNMQKQVKKAKEYRLGMQNVLKALEQKEQREEQEVF